MQRYAFKMFLNPGEAHEYRRRHDALWPELQALLSQSGVRNYSIFLDPDTNTLFAYLLTRSVLIFGAGIIGIAPFAISSCSDKT